MSRLLNRITAAMNAASAALEARAAVIRAETARDVAAGNAFTAGFIEGFKAQSRNTIVDEAGLKRDFDVSRERYLSSPWRATR